MKIVSRLVDTKRVRGTWLHDIVRARGGAVIMRDYSTGVWLDLSGRIKPAPEGMMEACVAGPVGAHSSSF